jgi:hypothetical protein
LQQKLDVLAKLGAEQRAAGILLTEQQTKAQRNYEQALETSRKSIGINNALGGRSNG